MPRLLYATNNPGKHAEVSRLAAQHSIELLRPADFRLEHEPEEIGASLEENAILKANAFRQFMPDDVYVMADGDVVEFRFNV